MGETEPCNDWHISRLLLDQVRWELLDKFRTDGTAEEVWKYVAADFNKITGKEVAA